MYVVTCALCIHIHCSMVILTCIYVQCYGTLHQVYGCVVLICRRGSLPSQVKPYNGGWAYRTLRSTRKSSETCLTVGTAVSSSLYEIMSRVTQVNGRQYIHPCVHQYQVVTQHYATRTSGRLYRALRSLRYTSGWLYRSLRSSRYTSERLYRVPLVTLVTLHIGTVVPLVTLVTLYTHRDADGCTARYARYATHRDGCTAHYARCATHRDGCTARYAK